MSNTIKEKIDRAAVLADEIKALTAELDGLKKGIKAYAAKRELSEIEGKAFTAVITSSGSAKMSFDDLVAIADRLDATDRISEMVSVNVGSAKKILGESAVEKVLDYSTVNPFGRILFR